MADEAKRGAVDAALVTWLEEHNAQCAWQKQINPNVRVEAYFINGRLALVMRHKGGGWDVFTGVDTAKIAATLDDAEKRLGVRSTVSP